MKWEDFKKERQRVVYNNYDETDIECPLCGENIYKRTDIVLTSHPTQYVYFCKNCGWSDTV